MVETIDFVMQEIICLVRNKLFVCNLVLITILNTHFLFFALQLTGEDCTEQKFSFDSLCIIKRTGTIGEF